MAEVEGDIWMQRRWLAAAGGGVGGGGAAAESILVSVFFFRPAGQSELSLESEFDNRVSFVSIKTKNRTIVQRVLRLCLLFLGGKTCCAFDCNT